MSLPREILIKFMPQTGRVQKCTFLKLNTFCRCGGLHERTDFPFQGSFEATLPLQHGGHKAGDLGGKTERKRAAGVFLGGADAALSEILLQHGLDVFDEAR